ncbi:acyl-CoA thioesterase [Nocardioides plantarum]|uniref:Acyl-CoA thioesterase n=1 Tax=Nocardioides plantarum TaxID=29299 RepID=A0ABV5KBZ1_9ACTN|nr:thioesterase family protein [Nocardioides plantarum]
MRHLYRCPMRWADLDLLGHVNNVTYVDYLQEARVDMMRTLGQGRATHDDLEDGVVVVRHEVTYLAPLGLRLEPIGIECWVTEVRAASFTMAYEVFHDEDDGGRTTYLRATTVLTPYVFAQERPRRLTDAEKAAMAPYVEPAATSRGRAARLGPLDRAGAVHYPLHVRFSDVDLYRHVNNVKYFEYFQEARVRLMGDLTRRGGRRMSPVVVAQTDVDYLRPILLRPTPYDVWSRVTRVGSRSMTIDGEIVGGADGTEALARSRVALVFWDPETQRSTEPPEGLRELLSPAVSPAS